MSNDKPSSQPNVIWIENQFYLYYLLEEKKNVNTKNDHLSRIYCRISLLNGFGCFHDNWLHLNIKKIGVIEQIETYISFKSAEFSYVWLLISTHYYLVQGTGFFSKSNLNPQLIAFVANTGSSSFFVATQLTVDKSRILNIAHFSTMFILNKLTFKTMNGS